MSAPERPPAPEAPAGRNDAASAGRSWGERLLYAWLRWTTCLWLCATGGLRTIGRENVPPAGGALLVSNHVSFLDVFALGLPLNRHLDFVARSTLFVPVLGFLIRTLGGFPIQRDGMGASGLKETLRRLRRGGIVLLFPEGTRSRDGRVSELKSGIAVIAQKARVPVVPAAVAGTFEAWPRTRRLPGRHAIRVCYGPPVLPSEVADLTPEAAARLIHDRIAACHREACEALAHDLNLAADADTDADRGPLSRGRGPRLESPLGHRDDFD